MIENFTALYATVFYVTVIALAGCELLPLNRQTVQLERRWPTNMGLFGLNFVIVSICIPITALEVAQRAGSGPLALLPVDPGVGIVVGVLALDLWKYCEHRVMHSFLPVWRFHLVHHTDTDVDFTTTERHHPIEVAFSSVMLLAVIYVLAVPPLAVVTFVLFSTVVTFVSHANLRLPGRTDRILRWLIITPSVHVIHHSAMRDETDSNYGAIFTIWDRLFGTYREHQADREASISVQGLEVFRSPRDARLDRVLWHPFAYQTTAHATTSLPAATVRDDGHGEAAQQVRAGWTNALLGVGLGLVFLVFAFQSTAMQLVSIWSSSTTYSYAWLVLPAVAYILWHHRERFFADRPSWSPIGIAASAVCGVAWLVSDLLNIGVGRQFALVAALPCLVLSAVGARAFALFGITCGIFANGLRVVSIVLLDWIQGTRAELSSHVLFQWVAFAFAITLMVAALMWLKSEPEEPAPMAQTGSGAHGGGRSLFA